MLMNRNRNRIETTLLLTVVFAITFAMRVASCRESFWLDELHTAWAVSGTFGEVAERAAAGNQTTGYFHLMWVWRNLFGDTELAMRLSSVLAGCAAASVLAVAVRWRSGSIVGGLAAGVVFALEPNAIFFGSELRPYGMIMLFSVLATWSAMAWLKEPLTPPERATESRWASRGGARYRLAMLFWVCVAALIHPTSLGVLAWLIAWALIAAVPLRRLQVWRADLIAVCVVAATLLALTTSSLPESWRRRDHWRSFASAESLEQILTIWHYGVLIGLPMGIAMAGFLVRRFLANKSCQTPAIRRSTLLLGLLPMLVAVSGTIAFFVASYAGLIPLWHRRYFIAALPLFAWTAGELVAWGHVTFTQSLFVRFRSGRPASGRVERSQKWIGVVAVSILIAGLMYAFYWPIGRSSRWPVWRYERWNAAVKAVDARIEPEDSVWLDSGLIEAHFLLDDPSLDPVWTDLENQYLRFPLLGPYRIEKGDEEPLNWDQIEICSVTEPGVRLGKRLDQLLRAGGTPTSRRIWLISRSSPRAIASYLQRASTFVSLEDEVVFPGRPAVILLRVKDAP